jgi:ACT domain-containing protein
MSAFTVELGNQPGALTGLCEAMASRSVNLLCATHAQRRRRVPRRR